MKIIVESRKAGKPKVFLKRNFPKFIQKIIDIFEKNFYIITD